MKINIESMTDAMFGIEIFPGWIIINLPFVEISIMTNRQYNEIEQNRMKYSGCDCDG